MGYRGGRRQGCSGPVVQDGPGLWYSRVSFQILEETSIIFHEELDQTCTKQSQNISWVWLWTVFIPLHSRKRLSLSHHSQKHSNTADIHPCCLVCHVRVPAWQHVWNEMDRWRVQRWREDGRHAAVVGERGMRDVHGGHTPTWWQGERTRPIHSEWK